MVFFFYSKLECFGSEYSDVPEYSLINPESVDVESVDVCIERASVSETRSETCVGLRRVSETRSETCV